MPRFLSTPRLSTSPLFAFLGVIVIAGGWSITRGKKPHCYLRIQHTVA